MFDDPFATYRTTLFIALTAYYVITTTFAVIHVAGLLRGTDPHRRLLRVYLSYQLATIRGRPLASELVQIGLLAILLLVIWQLHP